MDESKSQRRLDDNGPLRGDCPACVAGKLHDAATWKYHPFAGHGIVDGVPTHPDLPIAKAAAAAVSDAAKT